MKILVFLVAILIADGALVRAQDFQVGIYADEIREITCVTGQADQAFEEIIWAWVPPELELAYLTLRFRHEGNLDLSSHPEWNPDITQVIITDYPEETVEWNLIFANCPAGWVRVFSQTCILLDDQPGQLAILPEHSLARDCFFELHPVQNLNDLLLNDPECTDVRPNPLSLGSLKACYSH